MQASFIILVLLVSSCLEVKGFSLPLYKQWCGPGWPVDINRGGPPADLVDRVCCIHDFCYEDSFYFNPLCDIPAALQFFQLITDPSVELAGQLFAAAAGSFFSITPLGWIELGFRFYNSFKGSEWFDWYEKIIGGNMARCAHKYSEGVHVGPGPKKHMCCDTEMSWCVVAKGKSFKDIGPEAEAMFADEARRRLRDRVPQALFFVIKYGTGSGKTELHAASSSNPGTTPYDQWALHVATALPPTDQNWLFLLRANKDLVAINRNGASSTELYFLTAASNYQSVTKVSTGLHPTDASWTFGMVANGDLYAATKLGVQTTEVHVLSATSNYQQFSGHHATVLPRLDASSTISFALNGDLFAITTQSGAVKLQLLFAGDNYQSFVYETNVPISPGESFRFLGGLYNDLILVKSTGAPSTEVHILSALSNFQEWRLHSSSIQGPVQDPNQYDFLIVNPLTVPTLDEILAFNHTITMKAISQGICG